jgi:lysophospholipase L1-like esterase
VIACISLLWVAMQRTHALQPALESAPTGQFAALKTNDVILFQGDSITDGGRQKGGADYNHIMGQCYAYIIAADLGAQLPERNLTFINRGIDGNSVVDLAQRWQKDTLDIKPNMLSIAIGVNDTVFRKPADESVEQFEAIYDKLLGDTLAALPKIKIVLCEPFLLPVGNTHNWPQLNDPNTFKAEMTELKKHQDVVAKLAQKYNLPEVMLQKAFDDACKKAPPEHWSWDGVHPTYAGHGLMVQEWKRAVDNAWPHN